MIVYAKPIVLTVSPLNDGYYMLACTPVQTDPPWATIVKGCGKRRRHQISSRFITSPCSATIKSCPYRHYKFGRAHAPVEIPARQLGLSLSVRGSILEKTGSSCDAVQGCHDSRKAIQGCAGRTTSSITPYRCTEQQCSLQIGRIGDESRCNYN